jgi:hypothetical protein
MLNAFLFLAGLQITANFAVRLARSEKLSYTFICLSQLTFSLAMMAFPLWAPLFMRDQQDGCLLLPSVLFLLIWLPGIVVVSAAQYLLNKFLHGSARLVKQFEPGRKEQGGD